MREDGRKMDVQSLHRNAETVVDLLVDDGPTTKAEMAGKLGWPAGRVEESNSGFCSRYGRMWRKMPPSEFPAAGVPRRTSMGRRRATRGGWLRFLAGALAAVDGAGGVAGGVAGWAGGAVWASAAKASRPAAKDKAVFFMGPQDRPPVTT